MPYNAKLPRSATLLAIAFIALTACGRAGPPIAVVPTDADGEPIKEESVAEKPFILDPLLN